MAITDPKTVLILGAGVSVPFGLPVGNSLIDDIAQNLEAQLESFNRANGSFFSINPLFPINDHKTFLKFPFLQPLLWKIGAIDTNLKLSIERSKLNETILTELLQMQKLSGLLKNQTSDSIDDFIIMNPSYSEHVKICIAAEFIQALYVEPKQHLSGLELIDLQQRYLPKKENWKSDNLPERNWIHRLINLVRLGISEKKVTEENKIVIITFNYDTILEYVLEKQFSNVENGGDIYQDYRNFIEIVHVHGQLGELVQTLNVPSKSCWEWAKGIKVIREDADSLTPAIQNARSQAKAAVEGASEIYCCGFAFAKANTDLLGLSEKKSKTYPRKIHYCNFSGDIGLKNAAEKFAHTTKSGSVITEVIPQDNIGVSDWIGIGTIGELP